MPSIIKTNKKNSVFIIFDLDFTFVILMLLANHSQLHTMACVNNHSDVMELV
ncbi:hypothetical protein VAE151_560398 [Vibrio aestuarianus]|uniref:Uncharacterized protein n=1 Tax=Vibrio aestuarianus TaxID=28171 RepID=A0ABM9FRV1_9VIBR|nr:hypothetical protein VAE308_1051043 [Vibrio aestuarianus]CAH8204372.1 hypothetical protein VIBAE_A31638 [Vibrio aestuarianus subsp. francensis]CAH8205035.1 hypothetical protein VAE055_380395 [Vibrio aestuarianus]CAH8205070.1 hypothetical protein VAE032_271038 [Vibrio aestuarianus]CAH8205420.1 hypothetical protein VAE130_571042 [Vibrio aestuarianus]